MADRSREQREPESRERKPGRQNALVHEGIEGIERPDTNERADERATVVQPGHEATEDEAGPQ